MAFTRGVAPYVHFCDITRNYLRANHAVFSIGRPRGDVRRADRAARQRAHHLGHQLRAVLRDMSTAESRVRVH